jgi:hypothetical protein
MQTEHTLCENMHVKCVLSPQPLVCPMHTLDEKNAGKLIAVGSDVVQGASSPVRGQSVLHMYVCVYICKHQHEPQKHLKLDLIQQTIMHVSHNIICHCIMGD